MGLAGSKQAAVTDGMTDPSLRSPGNPLPSTPQRRGGQLQNLLAQFGSQSSAESATKTRRTSAQTVPKQEAVALSDPDSKRTLRQQQAPRYAPPSPSTTDAPKSPEKPAARRAPSRKTAQKRSNPPPSNLIELSTGDTETSEDELAAPRPTRTRGYKKHLKPNERYSDLKMEARKKASDDSPRRRSGRHTRVLESDTVQKQTPSPRRQSARTPKLDTTRARLRDGI